MTTESTNTSHPIKIRNCTFGFSCEEKWEDMKNASFDNDSLKFCGKCEKNVYLVVNSEELLQAIELNHCVAIEVRDPLIEGEGSGPHILMGMPADYSGFDDFEDDTPF